MRQGMKLKILFLCILTLTIGWMILIFGFSSQSGEESGGLSAIISEPVTKLLSCFRDELTPEERSALYLRVDGIVRVVAHFCEYVVLGGLIMLLLRVRGVKVIWLPLIFGTLFAFSDEWHQSYSPGRVCDPADVVIDALGVLCGVLLCNKMICIWRTKYVHHS